MESASIITVAKMLEALPESMQNQVVDHLREYIAEMQDDAQKAYDPSYIYCLL